MQYALLIYAKPGAAEALAADEQEANHREYLDIRKLPGVVGGAALHPVETSPPSASRTARRWSPTARSASRPRRSCLEDHAAYRGELLEACRIEGGGAALGRGERGAQSFHRVPFQLGD